jgi:hypothetical protein
LGLSSPRAGTCFLVYFVLNMTLWPRTQINEQLSGVGPALEASAWSMLPRCQRRVWSEFEWCRTLHRCEVFQWRADWTWRLFSPSKLHGRRGQVP